MAHDSFDLDIPAPPPSELRPFPDSLPPPPAPPRNPRRRMMLAGVCGACVMGAGLGLWARPAESERQASVQALVRPQAAAQQARQLQIVVDDAPAPIGAPMEVMRAVDDETLSLEPAAPEPEPIAPTRPPAGLVRVLTTPLPAETADLEPAPQVRKAEIRKPEPAKVEKKTPPGRAEVKKAEPKTAEAAKPAKKKPARDDARVAEAKTPKAEKVRKAKAEKGEGQLAKATPDRKKDPPKLAKADKPSKADKARLAKTERAARDAEKLKLAKAERAKAEKARVAKSELAAKAQKLKLAEAAAKAKLAKAAKPRVEKAEAAPVRKPATPVKGGGPLRMVSNSCASSDPAENLVCADPALGAAERRLARAYRQAEAAGVSAAELRRQQQRWLAARAAAAREAPWAVQDVYQARIAELEDLTRDAGY